MGDRDRKLSDSARAALDLARQQAEFLGQTYIGTEHVILGILLEGNSAAAIAMRRQNISANKLLNIMESHSGRGLRSRLGPQDFSSNMRLILSECLGDEAPGELNTIGNSQILLYILQHIDSRGRLYLQEAGCEVEFLQEQMNNLQYSLQNQNETAKNQRKKERETVLKKYTTDLTELARSRKLDPVIGREKETEQLVRILSRRSKNNPLLLGDAGVGKTAIVEGLAQRIIEGTVPERLKNKHILALDICALLAGSKFRGEFEERLQGCLAEAISRGDCIIFVDEIHTLSEAGSAEGATSAANLLKPQLARGDLQLIGATTWGENKRFLEKDAALSRRFQKIIVDEPDEKTAVEMLKGLCGRYELHHGVTIPEETLSAAVKLSQRYICDRRLPDKALDILDEASALCAQKHRNNFKNLQDGLQKELDVLDEEKRKLLRENDFDAAAELAERENEFRDKLIKLRPIHSQKKPVVTETELAALIAAQTGIAVEAITRTEGERLLHMEETLEQQVFGQKDVVFTVAKAIRCGRAGLSDPKRPLASFLFLGPSGVGKTQLCKVLAKELFGSEEALFRLDMSEFAQEHMVSRLIGAPPGYVGYQEGGRLTEAISRRPYSIILFDELEKSHPKVWDLLLQLLEEGELKDAEGKTVSFRNAVIIMTSNIGAEHFQKKGALGFAQENEEQSYELAAAKSREELKKIFRPEFLNRIDETLVFRWLGGEQLRSICVKLLSELNERLKNQQLFLSVSESAIEQLCKDGYEPQLGARPLKRCIRKNIEQPLAAELISGAFPKGSTVLCNCNDGEYHFCLKEIPHEEELAFQDKENTEEKLPLSFTF